MESISPSASIIITKLTCSGSIYFPPDRTSHDALNLRQTDASLRRPFASQLPANWRTQLRQHVAFPFRHPADRGSCFRGFAESAEIGHQYLPGRWPIAPGHVGHQD